MIYHNPKKIIERFLKRFDSSEKIRKNNDFELFSNIISENLSKIQKRENSVKYEKLESAYIAEFLKKKTKKPAKKLYFPSLRVSKSQNSISSLPTTIEHKQNSKSSERMDRSTQFDSSQLLKYHNSSTPSSKVHGFNYRKGSLPSIKNGSALKKFNLIQETEKYSVNDSKKIRVVPKDKRKAMDTYYKVQVKPNFVPFVSSSKRIQQSLQCYESEKLKTFKDFKIVKLFN